MEALLETKIFKVSVERLLLNGGQTLYMVGIALLIGTVIGTLLALVLVLCRKGGLVENKVLHSIVSLYINVVRSVPFIILLVTIMPLTRAILGTTIGSTAALVPLPLDKLWFCMMEMSLLAAARSARRRQRNADSQNTGSGLDSHMLNGGHDHCGACCCGSCGALKLTQTEVDLRRLSAQIPSGSMVLTTKGQAVIE